MENKTPFMTEIPEQEPQRQQYFMAHAKEQLHILEENLGRPLTCCINTFGCQMNARDSEKLLGILETIGYQAVETEDADLFFIIPVQSVKMQICVFTEDWAS